MTDPTSATFRVETAFERVNELHPYATVALGAPHEGDWFSLESVVEPDRIAQLVLRTMDDAEAGTPENVAGNYLFRYLLYSPLQAAGFLFASEGQVLALHENVFFHDVEWLQHVRFAEPRLVVRKDNEVSSADVLFAEIERAYEAVIAAFAQRRYVARANAWGSILDALIQGFLTAGQAGLGQDEAWRKWEEATRGRHFPLRRRPRRFSCDINGLHEERAIRAGCCLWYMVPASKEGHGYCGTCYLMSDDQRRELIASHQNSSDENN